MIIFSVLEKQDKKQDVQRRIVIQTNVTYYIEIAGSGQVSGFMHYRRVCVRARVSSTNLAFQSGPHDHLIRSWEQGRQKNHYVDTLSGPQLYKAGFCPKNT